MSEALAAAGLIVDQASVVAGLAGLPVGPTLGLALASLDESTLTGSQWVDVMRARHRQSNHERGALLAAVAQVMLHEDPDTTATVEVPDEFAADEVRAALVMTRNAAQILGLFAVDLQTRLPRVLAAFRAGLIDQPRARIFSEWTQQLA